MKTKHSPPVSVLSVATWLFLSTCAVQAVETPTLMVSYVPDAFAAQRNAEADEDVAIIEQALIEAENEAVLYSSPSSDELEARAGDLELLVFTADERGKCPACDRVKPHVDGLSRVYPITMIKCSLEPRPVKRGDIAARNYGVTSYPTFVLVERQWDGEAVELARWSGCGSFFHPCDERIKAEFKKAGFTPSKVPSTEPIKPRPIPGLKPLKPPVPKEKGRSVPRGREPGRPRFSFDIDLA